jgi:magnesium and cobalt exporter, CNNM family
VLSGAFSGATIGLRLSQWLHAVGVPEIPAEVAGVALVVAAITYLSLIIGELVPKQIALRQPEQIAVRVAPTMALLARISSPLVWFLDASGRLLLRALGHASKDATGVTDEEIQTLIAEAERTGLIEPSERRIISRVMRLGDRSVQAVMTPRHQVDMIDLTDDSDAVRRLVVESAHSRLPVHAGNPDEMLGFVRAKDLLDDYFAGRIPSIRDHVRTAPTVADTADVLDVVDLVRKSAVNIAFIHDEYGHFEGLVTPTDVLEAIVGALRAEMSAEAEPVRREDGSWLISGSMAADEMAEQIGVPIPQDRAYHTAAGFVLERLGRLPQLGESFSHHGWRFEVVDLDGHRIDKILARRVVPVTRRGLADQGGVG